MNAATASALEDPAVRRAVVAELRARAGVDEANGDRAYANGRYKLANGNWTAAAKRIRAAWAIDNNGDVNPGDHGLIESAWANVRDRARAGAQEDQ